MRSTHRNLLITGLVAILLLSLYALLPQNVPLTVDGQSTIVRTRAHTVAGVLQAAGVTISAADRIEPAASQWFISPPAIHLDHASQIMIWDRGQVQYLLTVQRKPIDLLAEAGITLNPEDRFFIDGIPADLNQPLSPTSAHTLQLRRAVDISLTEDGTPLTITSAAATLAQALWEAGVEVKPGDRLEPAGETPLDHPKEAVLTHTERVTVTDQGKTIPIHTAAQTVGEALADAGMTIQGLDFTEPTEGSPIPSNKLIRLVRVREDLLVTQETLPFETEYQMDPETELDHESIVDPGQPGLVVSRTRLRYEDGQEVLRTEDAEWLAQEPANRVMGHGTKVVVRTMDVGGQTIEYWRKVSMYATSYSPCRLGTGSCSYGTAAGLTLRHGIAAVTVRWFRDMRGQQVYVPGYGKAVIGDTGGGIPGRYWIDLGYSDEDYVSWHQWVTVYFLTPVPPYIPYILYP